MKKTFFLILTLICFNTYSQSVDFIIGASSSHFFGDLGGKPFKGTNDFQDLDLAASRWGLTTGLRFNFSKSFALRTNVWFARIAGSDKYTTNKERKGRNLSFYSNIIEGDLVAEVTFAKSRNGKGYFYFFGGLGYFSFNPKTRLNGKVYNLQEYGTEGQYAIPGKKPYALNSICYPNGLGYKLGIGRGKFLTFELNMRKTQTDYIDDVSDKFVDPALLTSAKGPIAAQLADRSTSTIPGLSNPGSIRGNPSNNDSFVFFCISYNVTLGKGKGGSAFGTGGRAKGKYNRKGKCFEF